MAVEIAGTCLHWSQPPVTSAPLSPKTVALAISSLLHNTSINFHDRAINFQTAHYSAFLGTSLLHYNHQSEKARAGRRKSSSRSSLDGFSGGGKDEGEFVERLNEIAHKYKIEPEFQKNKDGDTRNTSDESAPSASCTEEIPSVPAASGTISPPPISINPEISAMLLEPWPESDRFVTEKVERRVNSIDLPLSLRILKRKKKRWELTEMTDIAYSSVEKAFSSMVFIVRELQSYAIRMQEALFYSENFQIQGILSRVQGELHASFVWLFHRIFSATPTLMVYLMLLLANFTVFSIADPHYAASPVQLPQSISAAIEESQNATPGFDSSSIKTFSVGRSAAAGGSGSGRGHVSFIASSADDDHSDPSSSSLAMGGTISPVAMSTESMEEEEATTWKGIVEEAEMMRASERHEALMDPVTLRRFVSPVTVEAKPDDLSAYSATELSYCVSIAEEPDDPLLLSNFAEFLYTVLRDLDRAEDYFKRAVQVVPADAEVLSRYANFLWVARNDLEGAEETFLEAIATDPGNSYYSANYAHFLWNTGGEDTCYPLGDCDTESFID